MLIQQDTKLIIVTGAAGYTSDYLELGWTCKRDSSHDNLSRQPASVEGRTAMRIAKNTLLNLAMGVGDV